MRKRITTSALALLAATAAMKTAQASSATITNSGSKTITDSAEGWWGEDTDWGDFGAGYSAGYTIYSNHDGSDKYEKDAPPFSWRCSPVT